MIVFNIKLQYMEYDDNYRVAMETIIRTAEKVLIPDIPNAIQPRIKSIYERIINGIKFAKEVVTQDKLKILTGHEIVYPTHNTYMSKEIYNDVKKSMIKQVNFDIAFHDRFFTISISVMKNNPITIDELVTSMRRMVSWLYVSNHYSDKEYCKKLNISLYFTNIKKGFPNSETENIGSANVNSGVSSWYNNSTSNILIFRYEEWFKVFVHECGHSYGIESHDVHGKKLYDYVKGLVSIEISSRIGEAYVETWARIIVVFYSAIEHSSDYDEFITLLRFNMQFESIFSAIQAYRILAFNKLPYNIVIDPLSSAGASYIETTNIFAYYILCGAFMYDPFNFIIWCDKHNPLLLVMDCSSDTLQSFEKYISGCLHNDDFEKLMYNFKHLANRQTGLRFTITELPKIDIK